MQDKCDELLETLAEVGEIISTVKHDILINLGDMNIDIKRDTKHVDYVKDFWVKYNLQTICDNLDYTCGINVIDHFSVYKHQVDMFSETRALHPLENSSDHEPIVTRVVVPGWSEQSVENEEGEKLAPKAKYEWKQADGVKKAEFKKVIGVKLKDSQKIGHIVAGKSFLSSNTKCRDPECLQGIDTVLQSVSKSMLDSCDETIDCKNSNMSESKERDRDGKATSAKKTNKISTKKLVPGWNDIVKPFKETAAFWFAIWTSCGKLRYGEVFNVMKRTKNQYHMMIRRVKRLKNYLQNCKLIEGNATNLELFECIKNARRDTNKVSANIEGLAGSKAAELFATKYRDLFNSVDEVDEMEKIKNKVEDAISMDEEKATSYITEDIICEAINRLKNSKADPCSSLKQTASKRPLLCSTSIKPVWYITMYPKTYLLPK